jgi:hypothetical protein
VERPACCGMPGLHSRASTCPSFNVVQKPMTPNTQTNPVVSSVTTNNSFPASLENTTGDQGRAEASILSMSTNGHGRSSSWNLHSPQMMGLGVVSIQSEPVPI